MQKVVQGHHRTESKRLWSEHRKDKKRIDCLTFNKHNRNQSRRDCTESRKADCFVEQEYLNDNGEMCVTKSTRKKWGNTNVLMSTGITKYMLEKRTKEILARVDAYCPMRNVSTTTRVRNVGLAFELLMTDHFNCSRATGKSECHFSMLNPLHVKEVTFEESEEWDIEEGARFIDCQKNGDTLNCRSAFKADDSPFQNFPKDTNSVTVGGAWHFCWTKGLTHSKYSNIITLVSGEGGHSDLVRYQALKQVSDMSKKKKFAIWCHIYECFVGIHNKFYACLDWCAESAIFGFFGATATFAVHGITGFIEGNPYAIDCRNLAVIRRIFETDIDPLNYDFDFEKWRTEERSGFVLTNTEILKHFQQLFEEGMNNPDNNNVDKNQVAKNQCVWMKDYALFEWSYCMRTEIFHSFHALMHYTVILFVYDEYCVSRRSPAQISQIFNKTSLVQICQCLIYHHYN